MRFQKTNRRRENTQKLNGKKVGACMRASTNGANLKLTHQNHLNSDIESKGKLHIYVSREKDWTSKIKR